jgi:hypothetical protein
VILIASWWIKSTTYVDGVHKALPQLSITLLAKLTAGLLVPFSCIVHSSVKCLPHQHHPTNPIFIIEIFHPTNMIFSLTTPCMCSHSATLPFTAPFTAYLPFTASAPFTAFLYFLALPLTALYHVFSTAPSTVDILCTCFIHAHSVRTLFTFSRCNIHSYSDAIVLLLSKTQTTITLTIANISNTNTLLTQTVATVPGEIFLLLNSSISNKKRNLSLFNTFIASGVISKFQTKFKSNQLWKCSFYTLLSSNETLNSPSKQNMWAIDKGDSGFQSGYG